MTAGITVASGNPHNIDTAINKLVYGYHTADPVLVESLVARLQDQYYLQGRF